MQRWIKSTSAGQVLPALLALVLFGIQGQVLAQQTQTQAKSQPQTAAVVVEKLHARLLSVMQNAETLGYAGRYKKLQPVIDDSFDLAGLARSSVRGYWKEFSPAQQKAFTQDFRRLSIDTYAQRFDGYNGESFETLETSDMARGYQQVKTHLIKANGEPVSLNYVLAPSQESWRIVNVVAQGVSDLALKRSQYVGVLKKQGVDAFLQRIAAQVKALPPIN